MSLVWHHWDPAAAAAASAKSLQSCPTLCDPIDGSPPGSPVPGILQARTLEWVAISFSNAWKGKVKVKLLSRVQLLVTSWTAAYQAPPSMGFSRQEYWSGVPLPSQTEILGATEKKDPVCDMTWFFSTSAQPSTYMSMQETIRLVQDWQPAGEWNKGRGAKTREMWIGNSCGTNVSQTGIVSNKMEVLKLWFSISEVY